MPAPRRGKITGPFGRCAVEYAEAGWKPLPVEPHGKRIDVDGYTGHDGKYPSRAQVEKWAANGFAAHNIAIRMPLGMIGIDVDAYGSKRGAELLAELEAEHGVLPPTLVITSRTDSVSGIRLFRVPARKQSWRGKAGDGIDVISWHYRYAVVNPSVHPDTVRPYEWYAEDDSHAYTDNRLDEIPRLTDRRIPDLPRAWADFLRSDFEGQKSEKLSHDRIMEWLRGLYAGDPCDLMKETAEEHITRIEDAGSDGGAHDAAKDAVHALVGDAVAGHTGLKSKLAEAKAAFLAAISERRDPADAQSEWQRLIYGEVRLRIRDTVATSDPCTDELTRKDGMKGAVLRDGVTGLPLLVTDRVDNARERAVEAAMENIIVGQEARRRLAASERDVPPDILTGSAFLSQDLPRPPALVDELVCADGNTVLIAQAKAGKTTLVHNLVRCVSTGSDFLGIRAVNPLPKGKRITLLDFEMDAAMLQEWLSDQFEADREAAKLFNVVSLKGKKNSFNILDYTARTQWEKMLKAARTGYLILDCLAPALSSHGLKENDNDDTKAFLDAFETLSYHAGIPGTMVVHHSGRYGEHARGASAIDGWATDELRLTLEHADDESDVDGLEKRRTATRYLSAHGRLATEFAQCGLSVHDRHKRWLVADMPGRFNNQVEEMEQRVIETVTISPGISFNALFQIVRGKREVLSTAIQRLEDRTELCRHKGARNSIAHYYDACPEPEYHEMKKQRI